MEPANMAKQRSATELLPLKAEILWLLLSLHEADRHGYGLMRDVEARSAGAVRIQTGALYRLLHRMEADGLVEEVAAPPEASDDRRRYYGITRFGTRVAGAELERMRGLVDAGVRDGILARPGRS